MNFTDQSQHQGVQRALNDLRTRTAANLQAFNDAVPYHSWLRRSEIENITINLLRTARLAPQRRRPATVWKIKHAISWIRRVGTAA